jgi:WD40 repeat protein/DNA-binding SARP family transcriptional activator
VLRLETVSFDLEGHDPAGAPKRDGDTLHRGLAQLKRHKYQLPHGSIRRPVAPARKHPRTSSPASDLAPITGSGRLRPPALACGMHFLVLGPFEVTAESGDPLPIAGSKERTILACLIARAGRVVPVDDLIEELWGDHPPRTAERTLGSYVSRLRRALQPGRSNGSGPGVIVSSGDGYSLDYAGHQIDAIRFEQLAGEGHRLLDAGHPREADPVLEGALGLWRGAAYQGYRYTGFGAAEGERLDELRRAAAEDLIDSRLAGGDVGQLVPELEGMVREEPLRERRWGQLMVALYRAGRQAEALQAFTRARGILVGELGVEPGSELQRLQAAILAQDPELHRGSPAQAEPMRPTDVCPYKGLARFEAADAEFFFGREQVVSEGVGHLVGGRFLALVGASGSGKSSLLRAGILHALGSGAIPGSNRWTCAVIRPGDHPLDVMTRAMSEQGEAERRVLAVDQFEEVFTACSDVVERTAFLDAITEAAAVPDGTTRIVIAMRADFYGRCAEHRALASLLASGQILVGPMDREELYRAIERPAERAGLTVEEKLVDSLVSDTVGQPGGLPLLSTALLELWTRRRDRTLHLDDYLRAGGVEGAVARLAEDAFGRLDADEQAAAKRILLRLAAPGEGAEVVRRPAPFSEFDLDRDADASRAMAVLTDARLVTLAEGTAEVAHEALLREWPRLRTWLEDDAEGRKLHRHVTESSHTWDEGGRDPADLYRGARLTATWEWAEPREADLNDLEREFLRASRSASEGEAVRARGTNRRLRGLLAGVAVLLAASLVIGDLALTQRNRATDALTRADAGRLASRSRVEQDPVLALLLAREAVNLDDSAETRSALFAALERSPAITDRIYGPSGASPAGDETQWIAMSPDGRTLAIGDASPTVEFFDAVRRVPLGAVSVGTGTDRAAFSPDGGTLVISTPKDELVSIDVDSRTERGHLRTKGPVDAMAFGPNGTSLVTAEAVQGRESLVPRDPVTLEPSARGVRTRRGNDQIPPLASFAMAFSSDGRWLVTTGPGRGLTVVWNAHLRPVGRFPLGGNDIAISPNGRVAAIVENRGEGTNHTETRVAFLNIRTGVSHVRSIGHGGQASTQFEITGVGFSPDGRSVVTAGNDSRLVIWDVATASIRQSLGGTGDVPLRGPVVSLDGTTAFTTDRNRDVVVWDLTGRNSLARRFSAGSGFFEWPYFAISPNGRLIAVASVSGAQWTDGSGTIALIDTSSLRVVLRIQYRGGSPMGLAFSPDSSTLAVGSWNYPRYRSSVRLWNVASGRPKTSYLPGIHGSQVWTFAFSPDGRTLAGGGIVRGHGSGGRAYVWDLSDGGRLVDHLDAPQPINQLAATPNGSLLTAVTGLSEGGDLMTWDARSLASVLSVPIDNVGVYSSDVSNDGRTIVTGGQAGPRVWDIATGNPVGPALTGLNGLAGTIDMSSDGGTVVGADESGDVVLWDVRSGATIGDPLPVQGSGKWLAALFTPDGRHVFVVSETGAGWVWDVEPSDWEDRVCKVAGRNLTHQEWQKLLPDRAYDATCSS